MGLAPGAVAEWLRSGLQSRLHRFDSGRRLSPALQSYVAPRDERGAPGLLFRELFLAGTSPAGRPGLVARPRLGRGRRLMPAGWIPVPAGAISTIREASDADLGPSWTKEGRRRMHVAMQHLDSRVGGLVLRDCSGGDFARVTVGLARGYRARCSGP